MSKSYIEKNPISLLKASVNTLVDHKIILFPFCITAFIQLLILEVLFFAPRYPLNLFFGPIIKTLWSESFLHYPLNFVLLPKLFQYSQFFMYIFISSYFIAVAIGTILTINEGKPVQIKQIMKKTVSSYIHIFIAAFLTFFLVMAFIKLYGLAMDRAMVIRSETGLFYVLKRIVLDGAPFFNLLLSVFVSAAFAYVIPIIIIEKKKIFGAIAWNFKTLWKSFWVTFFIIFVPSLFFIPILLLRASVPIDILFPEIRVWVLVLSIMATVGIDAVVYTALTTYYLVKKENQ